MIKTIAISLIWLTALSGVSQIDQEDFLDSLVSSYSEPNAPGVAVGVVLRNELVYSGTTGLANLEYDVPIGSQTIFGLASITKQITSACIGILEYRAKLNSNDDVRMYIPELPFFGDTIRIKHLLNHTSGLRNHNVLLDLQGFDYDHQGYTNEIIEELIFKQQGVNHPPGNKMLYSNSNYVLLALIVKRVSGKSIAEFSNDELFKPLEMDHTFFKTDIHQVVKNKAHSYYRNNDQYMEPVSLTLCVGAGGVGSTIKDMAKWSAILLNSHPDFGHVSSFISTLDTLNDGSSAQCARGLFVSPYKGYRTLNHGGRDLGMRSHIIAIPELKIAVAVFANSEHINAEQISYQVIDAFLDPVGAKQLESKVYPHSGEELNKFVGNYQELNSDLLMNISHSNDTLWAKSSFGRAPVPLVDGAKNSLHRKDNASIVYTFHSASKECNMTVDFGGAMFYFEEVELVESEINAEDFSGSYFSPELGISYHISTQDGALFLSFKNNNGIQLYARRKDEFGSNRRTRYTFKRDSNGNVFGFDVAAEGTVKEIEFLRDTSN